MFLPNEKVIFRVHRHWLYLLFPLICLIVFSFLLKRYFEVFIPEGFTYLESLLLVVMGFVMFVLFLDWFCTRYYLTNMRLIEERGIIGKRFVSVWLDKVQDVTCKFGVLGEIFGFGDLEIESAGTYGKIVFSFVPSPKRLQKEIEEAILNYKKHAED